MSDDKMFEFMTKMYSEMQEGFKDIKTEFKDIKTEVNDIKTEIKENTKRLDAIENDVKKLGVKIDGKLIPTSDALLDGYKGNSEHITIIDDKIDRLQIDVNSISMKVSYNDSRIIEISKNLRKVE
ncbi:hypothetical protein [Clostridium estertheticum]|uniref:hypothetical protein n=1 Tax=Clostridium estertheticum TaxID=238834 RepID=UPI001C6F468A|nr:hypothetical protein [Clostridium estertheticum]MBW9152329.1 hypothetical protein [Clostridium estertheticum]WLC82814.1 hypothetical protein KTC97_11805 [Clostridium estertheticum]